MTRLATSFFEKPWLIYIAAMFHDIAKAAAATTEARHEGRAGFLLRHGLTKPTPRSSNGWSDSTCRCPMWPRSRRVRPRRDPPLRRVLVQTERRLTALYILTHADIRGTSPKVWNGWKGKLLEDLFFATQRLLRGATPSRHWHPIRQEDAHATCCATTACVPARPTNCGPSSTPFISRHDAEEIAWHTRMLYYRSETDEPVIKARPSQSSEGCR